MKAILSEKRSDVSITASLAEMVENPYIIFEQYIGMDSDDTGRTAASYGYPSKI